MSLDWMDWCGGGWLVTAIKVTWNWFLIDKNCYSICEFSDDLFYYEWGFGVLCYWLGVMVRIKKFKIHSFLKAPVWTQFFNKQKSIIQLLVIPGKIAGSQCFSKLSRRLFPSSILYSIDWQFGGYGLKAVPLAVLFKVRFLYCNFVITCMFSSFASKIVVVLYWAWIHTSVASQAREIRYILPFDVE